MKEDFISVDLYRRGVAVISGTKEELADWLEKNDFPSTAEWAREAEEIYAATDDNGSDIVIVSLEPMNEETAVHELCHAAFRILRIVDISPTLSEESYAYLLEFLYAKWREITSQPCDVQLQ